MKTIKHIIFCLFGFANMAGAQTETDSMDLFKGHYILGSSAEMILQYAPTSGTQIHQLFDFTSDANTSLSYQETTPDSLKISANREMDVAKGDLNGDYSDEIISAWQIANHSIALSIPKMKKDTLSWNGSSIIIIDSAQSSGIRLVTGNFDNDPQKEFILAYNGLDGRLHIKLYQTDAQLNLEKMAEVADDTLKISNTEFGLKLWDIAVGDFDGDGLSEVVVLNLNPPQLLGTNKYKITSDVKIYDFNPLSSSFISKSTKTISVNNSYTENWNFSSQLSRLSLTTGDFDNNGKDEVVYGFEQDYYRIQTDVYYVIFVPIYYHYYYTYFTEKLHTFRISEDLGNITYPKNLNTIDSWHYDGGENAVFYKKGFPLSLYTYDLNNDSIDEILGHGSMSLGVFDANNDSLGIIKLATYSSAYSRYDGYNRRTLAAADLFARPDSASSWKPEIVLITYTNTPGTRHIYPYAGKANITICQPQINASKKITGIKCLRTIPTNLDTGQISRLTMAIGDFDGDTLKFDHPTVTKKSVLIPTIIVNAPPSHFDILNKQTYDVNMLYDESSDDDPKTSYTSTKEESSSNTTEVKKDWGVSTELKAGGGFLGIDVEATLSASYGKEFSLNKSIAITSSMTSNLNTSTDDLVYGTNTDYYFFEYPVYCKGKKQGDVLVSNPVKRDAGWKYTKNLDYSLFSLSHEPGNLLSYPAYTNTADIPELFGETNAFKGEQFTLSDGDPNTWELNYEKLQTEQVSSTQKFNISLETSVSGWGCSASFKGEYGQSNMASHETSLKNGFTVLSNFGKIDKSIGEVTYKLTPYVYWSQKGALVVDYNVDLGSEDGTQNWWDLYYGQKPDLAFILPFRNDSAKNITLSFDSKKILTSDIRYFPFDAKAGDTITILAAVRNFSLKDFSGNANVKFYLGDPDNGGELIKEYVLTDLGARKYETYLFKYKTPSSIPDQPWIFGVIDPENTIEEIHRNNNKAFTFLFSDDYPAYVSNNAYLDNPVNTSLLNSSVRFDVTNFPNPAHTETIIRFHLTQNTPVNLSIFNNLGVQVMQKLIPNDGSGWQSIRVNLSLFSPGMYYYRISTNNNAVTKKLIVE